MVCVTSLNLNLNPFLDVQAYHEIIVDEEDPEGKKLEDESKRAAELQKRVALEEEQGRQADKLAAEVVKAMAF